MARVVDFCPSSDDELPDLNTMLQRPAGKKDKPPSTSTRSSRKDLVPKSASKSVGRKVRRLESNSQISGNLLFQQYDTTRDPESRRNGAHGYPQKSPSKRRDQGAKEESTGLLQDSIIELEDDPVPSTSRTTGPRRLRPIPILEDSEEESQSSIQSEKAPQVKKSRVRRLRPAPRVQLEYHLADDKATSTQRQRQRGAKYTQNDQSTTSQSDSEVRCKRHETTAEEMSMHRTTDENSRSYAEDSGSNFTSNESSGFLENDSSTTLFTMNPRSKGVPYDKASLANPEHVLKPRQASCMNHDTAPSLSDKQSQPAEASPLPAQCHSDVTGGSQVRSNDEQIELGLAGELAKLRLDFNENSDEENEPPKLSQTTLPQTPSKSGKPSGRVSPTKHIRIPKTPHRPSTDAFWSQERVDDWNDQHSPRKLILPAVDKSPNKTSPKKAERKTFEMRKHAIASQFLQEIDSQITQGQIAELSEPTGGVKLVWSKTLNTTAGRANWRRETIRTKKADGTEVDMKYKHHASIELAEKVIGDEIRLLNVVAHEFCHLANFMVNGITNNPHGKEFKAWATKCSRVFGDRGIKVTTKHTYEIEFKYIWECSACGSAYKRHSKSIDPQRHRCGSCKGTLQQTKPTPRGGGKPSEYQVFVKEQMKIVKEENPGILQKDVMKAIAAKWANRSTSQAAPKAVDEHLAAEVVDLSLNDAA